MQNSLESHQDRAAVSFLLWKCCICFTGTTIKPQLSAVEIFNSFPLLSTIFLLTVTLAAGDGRGRQAGGRKGAGLLSRLAKPSCRLAERLSTLRLKESQPSGGTGYIHHARTHTQGATGKDTIIVVIITIIIIDSRQHHYRFPDSVKLQEQQPCCHTERCHPLALLSRRVNNCDLAAAVAFVDSMKIWSRHQNHD